MPGKYQRISPQKAQLIMQSNHVCIILDVRSKQEYNTRRIPGAFCLPNDKIFSLAPHQLPDKNAIILVYCKGGGRSKKAATNLVAMGYTNVYDFGGINNWPYEVE